MKRLVGGDYLLDLSSIELEESEDGSTKTNITDADVLAQLTNLKKYVKNPEMAKPVWVKLLNGENDELVIARGTFAVIDTGEFEICVQLDGYKLVIYIEFTQVTLDDTPIDDWYIDTNDAKYLFTSDAQNVKATIEDEDFGDVELAGDLSVGGDLGVTGNITGDSIIENMTGYSAELKEIENITISNDVYVGAVKNGNKLTFALSCSLTASTTITGGYKPIVEFTIPEEIGAKLIPLFSSTLDRKTLLAVGLGSSNLSIDAQFNKVSNTKLSLQFSNFQTMTADVTYATRFECTFLLSENLIS